MTKAKFATRYFKYAFSAKSKHKIHSPFVFELVTSVLGNEGQYYAYDEVEAIRGEMLKDKRTIQVTDFGAGSTRKSKSRKVADIARTSAKSPKFGKTLFRLVNHFKPNTILELGTSLGLSTLYLSKAATKAKVITMEGCPETSKIAEENFNAAKVRNIKSVVGNFDETLQQTISELEVLDFVFFDGNHRKEPTLNYFELCLPFANNDSVFVFDDIHWSDEMEDAWNEICQHSDVTVTVDLFFIGIVFFRKQQAKENFVIKF